MRVLLLLQILVNVLILSSEMLSLNGIVAFLYIPSLVSWILSIAFYFSLKDKTRDLFPAQAWAVVIYFVSSIQANILASYSAGFGGDDFTLALHAILPLAIILSIFPAIHSTSRKASTASVILPFIGISLMLIFMFTLYDSLKQAGFFDFLKIIMLLGLILFIAIIIIRRVVKQDVKKTVPVSTFRELSNITAGTFSVLLFIISILVLSFHYIAISMNELPFFMSFENFLLLVVSIIVGAVIITHAVARKH